jgi:hypothetical protein
MSLSPKKVERKLVFRSKPKSKIVVPKKKKVVRERKGVSFDVQSNGCLMNKLPVKRKKHYKKKRSNSCNNRMQYQR